MLLSELKGIRLLVVALWHCCTDDCSPFCVPYASHVTQSRLGLAPHPATIIRREIEPAFCEQFGVQVLFSKHNEGVLYILVP
jgi:hypothetical protein